MGVPIASFELASSLYSRDKFDRAAWFVFQFNPHPLLSLSSELGVMPEIIQAIEEIDWL